MVLFGAMELAGQPNRNVDPAARIGGPDLAGMLGDFGVRRAVSLMNGDALPTKGTGDEVSVMVDGIIAQAFGELPPAK